LDFLDVLSFLGFRKKILAVAYIDVNYFKGYIPLHNPDILHLIQGHPEGLLLVGTSRTDGKKEWQQRL